MKRFQVTVVIFCGVIFVSFFILLWDNFNFWEVFRDGWIL
jgi:hypothetical protein